MAEKKSGGRGYGGFHKDATPESVELAKYLRGLVKRAGKTQRDLEEPTGYGRTTISSFLNGEVVPPQAFVNKLVTYVTPPRQQPVCMGKPYACSLLPSGRRPPQSFPPRGRQWTPIHQGRLWPVSRPPPRTRPPKPTINSRRPTSATRN